MLVSSFPSSPSNWSAFKSLRASSESQKASQYAYKSDRDLVVLTTINSYLLVIADAALLDSRRVRLPFPPRLFSKRPRINTCRAWSPASMCFAPRWNCRTSSSA